MKQKIILLLILFIFMIITPVFALNGNFKVDIPNIKKYTTKCQFIKKQN